MKTKLLTIIVSIGALAITGVIVFGLAMLTFNFDRDVDKDSVSLIQEYVLSSDVEKLLIQNQIEYSDTLVVTGGPAFQGDPGCGAVMDIDSQIHWFEVDSISEPRKMTLYSENPMQCKINHSSCFCNAQTKLAEITIEELSYFTPEQEQEVGKRVQKYFETMPHEITLNKFVVGKYNFDMGENYTGICGAVVTDPADFTPDDIPKGGVSIHGYFSGYMDGPRLWDFSLSVDSEKLCAIPVNATIFEYEKLE